VHRFLLFGFGIVFAVGVPLFFALRKRSAARSLDALIQERFRPRAWTNLEIPVPNAGRIRATAAYDDTAGSGLVLVTGIWIRSRTAFMYVAGVLAPGASVDSVPKVGIVRAATPAGAIVFFGQLASRASVLAHFEAMGRSPR
jgi:hypothetical protein